MESLAPPLWNNSQEGTAEAAAACAAQQSPERPCEGYTNTAECLWTSHLHLQPGKMAGKVLAANIK